MDNFVSLKNCCPYAMLCSSHDTGEDYRIMLLPDHPTPICERTHTAEPIPYMIYDSTKSVAGVSAYNEKEAVKSEYNWPDGYHLIAHLLEL